MTDQAPPLELVTTPHRPSIRVRFVVAFLVGLISASALGAGALYAYDQSYAGRILPGVSVGSVDLSGLTPAEATTRLETAFAGLGEGSVILSGPDGDTRIDFEDLGRGPDVAAMVDEALAVGHVGSPAERTIASARAAINGVVLAPRVRLDATAVTDRIGAIARSLERASQEASLTIDDDHRFVMTPGVVGRTADPAPAASILLATLSDLGAPAEVTIPLDVTIDEPDLTTAEATTAMERAENMVSDIILLVGKDQFPIASEKLRPLVAFVPTASGGYRPVLDSIGLEKVLKSAVKKIDRKAVDATYDTAGSEISKVVPSQEGRAVDIDATMARIESLLTQRAAGTRIASVLPVVNTTEPALTTAEAKAARSKMKRISSWTTYFPISEKNGFGANIWIPAKIIDGYVVAPRAKFDFWDAVGPVTREKGYRQGGAIINGKTEPQGALAGGICSCSTTLFNAALRAGFDMGARRNHYYYIDRYPLGLDATVFISGSGAKQSMSFTNDTDYPVLIRGYQIRDGSAGYVKFEIYSVPSGRKVSFSKPIVRNIRRASDTVQYTSSLRPGVRQRIEYPVDGKQVWVTRTVRDRNGKVIHTDTYYSNYSRITGVTLVGKGTSAPEPSPEP